MEALYEVIHKKQEGDYLAKYFCLFFASILFKKVSSKMSLYGMKGFVDRLLPELCSENLFLKFAV
jgi:hypothetical protein